jgi:hypothetical protein
MIGRRALCHKAGSTLAKCIFDRDLAMPQYPEYPKPASDLPAVPTAIEATVTRCIPGSQMDVSRINPGKAELRREILPLAAIVREGTWPKTQTRRRRPQ